MAKKTEFTAEGNLQANTHRKKFKEDKLIMSAYYLLANHPHWGFVVD